MATKCDDPLPHCEIAARPTTILGEDGRKIYTRAGGTIKLVELLTEATDRAAAIDTQRAEVARAVGIGAVSSVIERYLLSTSNPTRFPCTAPRGSVRHRAACGRCRDGREGGRFHEQPGARRHVRRR